MKLKQGNRILTFLLSLIEKSSFCIDQLNLLSYLIKKPWKIPNGSNKKSETSRAVNP